MKLILDHRERDLKVSYENLIAKESSFKDIILETENLEIGDIIIRDDENNDLIIYERKTIADLIASIKDGRYNEQSYRMNGLEHHNHNIIYLIEGSVSKTCKERQMVYSAMLSINFYKGFSLMRSSNTDETAYIICNSFMKIKKEKSKSPYYLNKKCECDDEVVTDEKSYSTVIKKRKNENITPENFGEIILCQIPSISSITSIAIMKQFSTINNLIEELKKDDKALNNVTYQTEKNQTRKISKTSINNIIKFLLQ